MPPSDETASGETSSVETSSPSSSRAATISTVMGVLAATVAGVFVVRALVRNRDTIDDALDTASLSRLALGLVLAGVGMVAIAVPWRSVLAVLGARLSVGQTVARYFVGEIGKYVPGGVWPILGRGELARRAGVSRTTAYGSVFLSLIALYLAAGLVAAIGFPFLVDDSVGALAVVVALPAGLVALHPRVVRAGLGLVSRVARRDVDVVVPPWGTSVALVARYLPAWAAIGGATWAVADAFDPSAGLLDIGTAAVFSWIIGFVVVPVPGGVGVREAAFVATATSLDPGVAAIVAVVIRTLFVVVDATGAVVAWTYIRRSDATRSVPVG